jgi:hypothetical protein
VLELKATELKIDSDSESNPGGGKHIIDVETSDIVANTKIRPREPEEGECLFHSHMWVKVAPLHFIVDSDS